MSVETKRWPPATGTGHPLSPACFFNAPVVSARSSARIVSRSPTLAPPAPPVPTEALVPPAPPDPVVAVPPPADALVDVPLGSPAPGPHADTSRRHRLESGATTEREKSFTGSTSKARTREAASMGALAA